MSTFILVHGAFSGAWCWKKVIPLLELHGHRVLAVDLPSHGEDLTPVSTVTLEHYTNHLQRVIENEPSDVIVVGHSLGGLVISQTAERIPTKIKSLVYIAALLPENGQSFLHMNEKNAQALPLPITMSEDQTHFKLDVSSIRDNFYGESSEEDVRYAKSKHGDQPLAPFVTPVMLSDENYGSIKRYYIETLKDHSLSISFQREMTKQVPCEKVFTLDTDHSPFFSDVTNLVSILNELG